MSASVAPAKLPVCEPITMPEAAPKPELTPAVRLPMGTRRLPRDLRNDYTHKIAAERRSFIARKTGAKLSNVEQYSFDPSVVQGNIENFIGVAQVPIGVAGPLLVNGEHAKGEFYVPIATT